VPALDSLSVDGSTLRLEWADGHRSTFHAVWLRDNCPCPDCRHPSGQRLLDSVGIPDGVDVASARAANGAVEAEFTDGHAARFDADWLREHCYCGEEDVRPERRLWDASIAAELPVGRFEEVADGGEPLRRWLAAVDELGFAILTGGPTEPGTVTRVAELFGFVRETNYGRLFDVRSVVNPSNLAYTGLGLGAHTDNPYRDPTPTLQLLHCLASSAGGGDSTLVDAFRVAEELRARTPESFELLAGQPVRFRYRDEDTELEAEHAVISLDLHGDVQAVHFNTRSTAPLRIAAELVEPYYDAYRAFGRLLASSEFQIRFTLEPGDLFIVDNLRVLHGRTGFSDAGERHLQGCYADIDGLRSRLAVLSRSVVDEIFRTFRERGDGAYLGEPVSISEHSLQTALEAERDGAHPTLVAASLLHDYGHLIHDHGDDAAEHGLDTRHEDVAHAFLAAHFGPEVVEPIRMHVAAKRYLCAVDPSYVAQLSQASLLSLELQGGPYDERETAEFETSPHADDAVRLRRYDDAGKVAGARTPGFEHYRPVLESVLRR
jgi:gamma-butyrobetaine dioxygenase